MSHQPAVVYLVGAGPGDPSLLTLRGLECLQRADLVLYDGLVNPLLLRHARAECVRTCRISENNERRLDQAEINSQLIAAARAGKTVVRLKGGDPYIFGRGSEEAAALSAAGVPFEVVPGVTAAIAAGDYAGISFTHRDHTSAVAFITGHEDPDKTSSGLDYSALAKFPGTLVFYMGLHRLGLISKSLIDAGKSADIPVAVISRATTAQQRTLVGTLRTIAELSVVNGLRPPSLIVVGECVRQRDQIAWFESRTLLGKRIGVTRASEQADLQISRILELGAEPVVMPTLEITSPETWRLVDDAILRISGFDWLVFTSVNGVRAFCRRLWDLGKDVRSLGSVRIAAIGTSTAGALQEFHLRADVIPEEFRAEKLADALVPRVQGKRVLWVRAERVRDVLRDELTKAQAILEEVVVYRHHDVDRWSDDVERLLSSGELDWIGVSSPAIARNVARMLPPAAQKYLGNRIRVATISPVTSAVCREVGLPVDVEASIFTWDGIIEAIEQFHCLPKCSD